MTKLRKILLVCTIIGYCCWASPLANDDGSSIMTRSLLQSRCSGQQDCRDDECCTASPYRNTFPTCRSRTAEGQECAPGQQPTTSEGSIYFAHCPCAPNLNCGKERGVCARI